MADINEIDSPSYDEAEREGNNELVTTYEGDYYEGDYDGEPVMRAFCDNYTAHEPHTYWAINANVYDCPGITDETLNEMEEEASKHCEHGMSLSLCNGPMHW